MDYRQYKLAIGELAGVQINKKIIVCHRLFAEDLGVFILVNEGNYKKIQEIISLYEKAFGAQMNLSKAVIIPLGFLDIPQWVNNIGYKINAPGEIQQYLGAPIGNQLR